MIILHNGLAFIHRNGMVWADDTTCIPYAEWLAAGRDASAIIWQHRAPRASGERFT